MSAAEITPSVIQKVYEVPINDTGTPTRIVKYIFKVTKVTDGDWILTTVFQTGTPIIWDACTIDASTNGVQEQTVGMTYTNTGTKLTLSGGTTGTTYGQIVFEES